MRRIITIDIETIPIKDHAPYLASLPTSEDAKEAYLKTALNGDYGRILCLGFFDESPTGKCETGALGWDEGRGRFTLDEKGILSDFWERMKTFRLNCDRIVGHNIFDFDLKFILKRSIIHGVSPTVNLSFARYRNQPIYDTMHEWERWGYGTRIGLDKLAGILSLPSSKSEEVNGMKVFELYKAGNHQAIRDYCLKDVQLTHAIYRRMEFITTQSGSDLALQQVA